MQYHGTLPLETERLLLRPFREEDAEPMFRNWASSPEVTRFLTWPAHASLEVTAGLLRLWVSEYAEPNRYNWAIVPKERGEAVGNISVVNIAENISTATIGYCLSPSCWGQGIMPEAFRAVLAYLFDHEGFSRLASAHDVDNPKSGRVMQKVGMTRVGVLRKGGRNNQGLVDVVLYDMLADDPRL